MCNQLRIFPSIQNQTCGHKLIESAKVLGLEIEPNKMLALGCLHGLQTKNNSQSTKLSFMTAILILGRKREPLHFLIKSFLIVFINTHI